MAAAARALGATILEHSPAAAWGTTPDGVWAKSAADRYKADALIVTAGAWSTQFLADLGLPIQIVRKTL